MTWWQIALGVWVGGCLVMSTLWALAGLSGLWNDPPYPTKKETYDD